MRPEGEQRDRNGEEGFALIALVVAIFLVLLVLSVAAPRVAQELRRDREVEALHRGNQYIRGVQLYYRKFQRYPSTVDQLEKTTNIRFLRQKYVDPMTGKADWRLIHVGEAKTSVKGFFGKPLSGLNTQNIGSSPGSTSNVNSTGAGGSGSSPGGSAPGGAVFGGSSFGGSGAGGSSSGSGFSLGGVGSSSTSSPSSGAASGSTVSGSSSSSSNGGVGSQSATQFQGGGAPIIGIGSAAKGNSILELNEQTTYDTWEFLYDPRIEQLKARASLFGGGVSATSATTFGAGGSPGSPGSPGSTPSGPSGSTPSTPPTTPP